MKQYEAVILALEKLGGVTTLGQLYIETLKIEGCTWKTKTPFASIRRIVQNYTGEIYKIKPGLYGLLRLKLNNESKGFIPENDQNKLSDEIIESNHSYYQGLLLTVGNLKGFGTCVARQDKNKKFIDKTLVEICSFEKIPQFGYPDLVHKSSSVDVIWFNVRGMPHSFFEVEHTTDIRNSLLKFNDLQDFYSRMVIVADRTRKQEFENKIAGSAFKAIKDKNRVEFLDYESLCKQYERTIEQQGFEFIL